MCIVDPSHSPSFTRVSSRMGGATIFVSLIVD